MTDDLDDLLPAAITDAVETEDEITVPDDLSSLLPEDTEQEAAPEPEVEAVPQKTMKHPSQVATAELAAITASLDETYEINPAATAVDPMDVTVVVNPNGGASALYIDGTLAETGKADVLFVSALAAYGARVVSDDAHLRGSTDDSNIAPDLQSLVSFLSLADEIAATQARLAELEKQAGLR